MVLYPAEGTDMECKRKKQNYHILTLVLFFSSHIKEHQTSDLSLELAYVAEMDSILTIDDCVCIRVLLFVCTCGHES